MMNESNKECECSPYDNLKKLKYINIDRLPDNIYGVYGIWFRKRCIYIGKAQEQSIKKRLSQHWKHSHNDYLRYWIQAKGSKLTFAYKVITSREKDKIDFYERLFIRKFQPITNIIRYIHEL